MTPANRHRIQRQVLELDLASAAGAPQVQEEAVRTFREGARPALEELFDAAAGPHRLLRLERLEVDLGELAGPDWPQQLLARLAERLRQALPAAVASAAPAAARRESLGPAGAWLEELLFFLAHGRLPWWGTRPAGGWAAAPSAALGAGSWQALGAALHRDPRARRRLVQAAGDDFLADAVAALAGFEGSGEALRLLAPVEAPGNGPDLAWRRRFWGAVLDLALDGEAGAGGGPGLLRRLLADRRAVEKGPEERSEGGSTVREEAGAAVAAGLPLLPAPWQAWLEAVTAPPPSVRPGDGERDAGERAPRRLGRRPRRPGGEPARTAEPAPGERPTLRHPPLHPPADGEEAAVGLRPEVGPAPGERPAAAEAIYLPGAGAVILHPFLPELFRSRGLLDGPAFRDRAARHRAVHLLGRLTFDAEAPEYDLLLPKLLSAMPWEELLPPVVLDDEDREACDELIAAVLGHWRALKSASPAWLREQFFLREGKLERVEDGWRLTVERRAQDVLLARLPWGVGLVRLPWLPEVLHVSWTD